MRRSRDPQPSLLARSRKDTLAREYVCESVFRPVADMLVLALLPLRVPPLLVLLAGTATGLAAAGALGGGHLLLAALLVQAKTVLDNADGQLARASGRVSVLGRYLDSESDLLVNAALFGALGYVTGHLLLAGLAFLVLTLVLSADFNLERLYRRERGEAVEPMPLANGAARPFAGAYTVLYAPHDRLFERLVEARLTRLHADGPARLAYHDHGTLAAVAQLALSTQLAALGLCLAIGRPTVYLCLVLVSGCAIVGLGARRERLARARTAFTELALEERRTG